MILAFETLHWWKQSERREKKSESWVENWSCGLRAEMLDIARVQIQIVSITFSIV